jgi:diacylglycerol O-acyltransferase
MGRIGTLALQTTGRLVAAPPVPDLPGGDIVELAGRGRTYVVDTGWPDGRITVPTVVLLHALACTGLLTWYPSLDALRRRYRVVLFDQRGHGQGIRSAPFDLDDCADDVVAIGDALGLDRLVVAGYSLGSLVAQTAWHRHRDRVAGLVLAATTTHFADTARAQRRLMALGRRVTASAAVPPAVDASRDELWAWRQFRATSGRDIAAAAARVARFDSRAWIGGVDVPTAVVVTARDRLIPPARQRALADRIRGATCYEAAGGHASCVLGAERFRPALLAACASVTARVPR